MDRYTIYRKMAIKTWQEVEQIANSSNPIFYETYCLGKSSITRELQFSGKFKLVVEDEFKYFIDEGNKLSYIHHHLGDWNLLPLGQNCNQHLLFRDKQTAEDYAMACRNDEEECARQAYKMQMMDYYDEVWDRYDYDDPRDDYEYDELLDKE